MTKRLSFEDVRNQFFERGYELLEKEYINNHTKMRYRCPSHPEHVAYIRYKDFKRGVGCPLCAQLVRNEKSRTPFDVVKKDFENKGYLLLESNYENSLVKMRYKCSIHPDYTFEIRYHDLKNGKGCPACANNRKLTFEEVIEAFDKRGYTLLEKEYVNSDTKMKFRCIKHPEEPMSISWTHFREGNGCRLCGRERTIKSLFKYDLESVRQEFQKRELILVSDEYVNFSDKLLFECPRHSGEIQEKSLSHILRGQGCYHCYRESIRGENNPSWKGTSELSQYLRSLLGDWKRDVLVKHNFKCDITGKNGDLEVHHLIPFHKLRDETLKELNLAVFETVGEYSNEELNRITELLKSKHTIDMGVVLLKDVHRDFHGMYGMNTSEKDYLEFKETCLKHLVN